MQLSKVWSFLCTSSSTAALDALKINALLTYYKSGDEETYKGRNKGRTAAVHL